MRWLLRLRAGEWDIPAKRGEFHFDQWLSYQWQQHVLVLANHRAARAGINQSQGCTCWYQPIRWEYWRLRALYWSVIRAVISRVRVNCPIFELHCKMWGVLSALKLWNLHPGAALFRAPVFTWRIVAHVCWRVYAKWTDNPHFSCSYPHFSNLDKLQTISCKKSGDGFSLKWLYLDQPHWDMPHFI